MNDPTNEPIRKPVCESTKWLGRMHCFLSAFHQKVGYATIKIRASNVQQQGQDNEIQSDITDSSNTQPSNWQGPKQRRFIISVCVPFATFCSNLSSGLVYCWVCSRTGFEPVTSSTKVSCKVFTLLACEPVTSSTIVSYSVFTLLARETVTFTTWVSCNTFASLVCEPGTSTNQINRDKSTPTFRLVVASVSNNNALSFNDKSSFTFKLVVESFTNEFSKGLTIDSTAKQRPVLNDNPAIECSL